MKTGWREHPVALLTDWTASDEARREAKNDLFLVGSANGMTGYHNTQPLQYRGQFDVVRPVVRKLVSEMRQNPVDVLIAQRMES